MNIVVRYHDGTTQTAEFGPWTIVSVERPAKGAPSLTWGGEFSSRQSVVPQLEALTLNGDELYAAIRHSPTHTGGAPVVVGRASELVVGGKYQEAVRLPLVGAVSVRLV